MTVPDRPTRAQLLARLPALGLVPPEDAVPWSLAARSAAFAAAVEAFAAAYWSLAPADRRKRYNQLWQERSGPAAGRLAELETGLDIAPGTAVDPWVVYVTRLARELFVLPPRVRAARRTAALGAKFRPGDWAAAARKWLRLLPEFTLLDPQLYDRFVGGWGPAPTPHRERATSADVIPNDPDEVSDRQNALRASWFGCLLLVLAVIGFAVLRSLVR